MAELDGIFPARVSAHSLQKLPDEIGTFENGGVFIAWPKPPRVGSKVRIQLAFGEDEPVELPALVVWSRPPRLGTTGGFRAQLEGAPALVLARLRDLCATARQRLLLSELGTQRTAPARRASEPEFFVVRERVRRPVSSEDLEPQSALLRPRPLDLPPTPVQQEPELSLDLPEPASPQGSLELDWPHESTPEPPAPVPPPPERPVPVAPFPVRPSAPEVIADPVLELELPAPDLPVVTIAFASSRSYRMHFERFLMRGEVYVTNAPVPLPGEYCEVVVHVPDGDAPLRAKATMDREVAPPEVPRPGWIARLVDQDGAVAERLATAALLLSA